MKKSVSAFLMVIISTLAISSEKQFALLNELVGHCYQATFPDGQKVDTHCFSNQYNGAFIIDEHVVCGPGDPYYGQTWYSAEGEDKKVRFRYFNSLGGVSEGAVDFKEGKIVFPEEKYTSGSEEVIYKTVWTVTESQYTSDMVQRIKNQWSPIWQMNFKPLVWEQQNVVTRDAEKQLRCQK